MILSNVNSFQTENQLTTKPIIIVEDGLAQELLYEQFITDIVVDGANDKIQATAIIAKAGSIAIIERSNDPGSVILEIILSMKSDVGAPGLIPGTNPPFLLRSSAICSGLTVIAV